MVFLKLKINTILKNKIFWILPFLVLFFVFFLKTFLLLNKSIYISSFATLFTYSLIFLIFLIYIYYFNFLIFLDRDNFINYTVYYFSLGYSLNFQFLYYLILSFVPALICSALFSIVLWQFNSDIFLITFLLSSFLLLFRLISFILDYSVIYLVNLVLILSSFAFTVFIFPNLVYIVKSNLWQSNLYGLAYLVFYVYTSYLLYIYLWREECFGQ